MLTETHNPCAHAPGKLILSGEHSVLYGAPALAMAIARYTEVWFKPISPGEGLRTAFEDLSSGAFYPLKLLTKFKSSLDQRFEQFSRGELSVHKILTRPDDLAVYTLASLLQDQSGSTLTGIGAMNHLPYPGQLGSRSSIPVGAGLGSSAAVVAATTVLFEHLLERHKTLDERFERVRFCERLKHGKAGPIDAAAVVRGGLVQIQDGSYSVPEVAKTSDLLTDERWFWVQHGTPLSSTGECVSHVRTHHGSDTVLWQSFADCTHAIAEALRSGTDPDAPIRENQSLLERIGVVPEDTQALVAHIARAGGAAKVCGAGSVRGSNGGAVLAHMPNPRAMEHAMQDYPMLTWSPLRMAPTGAASGAAPATGRAEP